MAGLRIGQSGTLLPPPCRMTSCFAVTQITPVSTAKEGRNYFRVEARLTTPPSDHDSAGHGGGQIAVDQRSLVWIWTTRC